MTLADDTPYAYTAFHWACYNGHLSLVKWFVEEKGVDPNYCPKGYQSAMAAGGGSWSSPYSFLSF